MYGSVAMRMEGFERGNVEWVMRVVSESWGLGCGEIRGRPEGTTSRDKLPRIA
ncbi:hypothetical protein ATK36_3616 [Amycolatopsis sulphurea]|uniref:Uncharacterized protein n=1 Tax=Amycolatopsis sulphurea TaxID=76022 RepID=A0A2A9FCN5_9PSEU|nr:hypothetical protein ATK36_3616 [Amycolatopsis sulphurea]